MMIHETFPKSSLGLYLIYYLATSQNISVGT